MKIKLHPHIIQFQDGRFMKTFDMRHKGTKNKSEAYVARFASSAKMMAEKAGGIAVELSQPIFVTAPAPSTVNEWEEVIKSN